jgi:hypothetical protein
MIWYSNNVQYDGGEGILIGRWSNGAVEMVLEANGVETTVFAKSYQTMAQESPSEEEVLAKFTGRLLKVQRMLKDLNLLQIQNKRWNF